MSKNKSNSETSDQQSKVDKAFAIQKQNIGTASQNLLTSQSNLLERTKFKPEF